MVRVVSPESVYEVMDVEHFQEVQDALSKRTGFTLLTFLSDGQQITLPSKSNSICEELLNASSEIRSCKHYCGLHLSQIFRHEKPVVFKCFAHLTNFVLPYSLARDFKVFVLGGRVFTTYMDFSKCTSLIERYGVDIDAFLARIPSPAIMEYKKFEQNVQLLDSVLRLIFDTIRIREQAVKRENNTLTLFNTGVAIGSSDSFATTFATLCNILINVLDIDSVSIMTYDPLDRIFHSEHCLGSYKVVLEKPHHSAFDMLARRIVETDDPIHIFAQGQIETFGFKKPIDSLYLFPFRYGKGNAGLIVLAGGTLDHTSTRMLTTFSHQLSHNLTEKGATEIVEKEEPFSKAFEEIRHSFSNTKDTSVLLKSLHEHTLSLVSSQSSSLMVYDEKEKNLKVASVYGTRKDALDDVRVLPGEGICGKVFSEGEPVLVTNIETDSRFHSERQESYRTKSFISVPVKSNGKVIGVLNLSDKYNEDRFGEHDLRVVKTLVSYTGLLFEKVRLKEKAEALKALSTIDGLTGLFTRRAFEERLGNEFSRAQRYNRCLSLVLIDIDNFKEYNDLHGTQVSNEVLRSLARIVMETVRRVDIISRFHDDTFAILLPETKKEIAHVIAERFHRKVFQQVDMLPNPFTVSIGLTSFPLDAVHDKDLILKAETALQAAKKAGKNRIKVYDDLLRELDVAKEA